MIRARILAARKIETASGGAMLIYLFSADGSSGYIAI
jgi:hypothetical protein